jgi:hypothetical protein
VFAEALVTFDEKNADYGDAWRKNGWRGNLPRIFEKIERVRELLWRADPRTPAVSDETAIKTLIDMLNSIAFTVINLREEVEFGHEVPRSQRNTLRQPIHFSTEGRDRTFEQHVIPDELLTPAFAEVRREHPLPEGTSKMRSPEEVQEEIPLRPKKVADNPQA